MIALPSKRCLNDVVLDYNHFFGPAKIYFDKADSALWIDITLDDEDDQFDENPSTGVLLILKKTVDNPDDIINLDGLIEAIKYKVERSEE